MLQLDVKLTKIYGKFATQTYEKKGGTRAIYLSIKGSKFANLVNDLRQASHRLSKEPGLII